MPILTNIRGFIRRIPLGGLTNAFYSRQQVAWLRPEVRRKADGIAGQDCSSSFRSCRARWRPQAPQDCDWRTSETFPVEQRRTEAQAMLQA